MGRDKLAAYQTLYHVLQTIAKMIAPFIPFSSEALYQNLKINDSENPESVHLCYFPNSKDKNYQFRDEKLEEKMDMVLRTVNIGRALRNQSGVKIRQPLKNIVIHLRNKKQKNLFDEMENLIKDELNVKEIRFTFDSSELFTKKAEPIYKSIGPKFGKSVNKAAEIIRNFSESEIEQIQKKGSISIVDEGNAVMLTPDDIDIRTETRENLVVESEDDLTVALNLKLSEALINEGLARDFVNRVQNMRKEADFNVVDRIIIFYKGSEKLSKAIASEENYIKNETLADQLLEKLDKSDFEKEWNINGDKVIVGIKKL
jgi:isoleucyl-tRNA synthetase